MNTQPTKSPPVRSLRSADLDARATQVLVDAPHPLLATTLPPVAWPSGPCGGILNRKNIIGLAAGGNAA